MPAVGDIIDGRYSITRELGSGGMGSVFEATHTKIRTKKVAIKFLKVEHVSHPETLARFEREAEAASAVSHPGIIGIHDIGKTDDGTPYLVMDYLKGSSFEDDIQTRFLSGQKQLPIEYVCTIACKVLSALSAAHEVGIVHRDLKPDNIFLVSSGTEWPDVKILDFGIAGFKHQGQELSSLTKTGTIIGTPYYMSPEQARGRKDLDHRADLFSMGTILYQCLTGQFPFNGANYNDLIVEICTTATPMPSLYRRDLPAPLEAALLKALEKQPDQRYASADAMFDELRPFAALPDSSEVRPPRQSTGHPATWPGTTGREHPQSIPFGDGSSTGGSEQNLPVESMTESATLLQQPTPTETAGLKVSTRTAWESTTPERKKRWLLPVLLSVVAVLALSVTAAVVIGISVQSGTEPTVTTVPTAPTAPTAPITPPAPQPASAPPTEALVKAPAAATVPRVGPAETTPRAVPLNRWIDIAPSSRQLTLGLPAALSSLELVGFRAARGVKSPSRAFEIQQHEVTWAELRPWLAKNTEHSVTPPAWLPASEQDQFPVTNVPWGVAKAYCAT